MPIPGSDRLLPILALTLLGAGCVLVLWPFLTALVWAAILVSTSWPAFLWLDRSVGERRALAASLMTLLVTVVLLGVATFFLSVVPVGPQLVWGGAAIWLFQQGEPGRAACWPSA